MANFTTENNTYCFRIGPAFLDTNSLWIFRTIDSTTIVSLRYEWDLVFSLMKTTSYLKKNIRNQLNQAPETHWETSCSEKEETPENEERRPKSRKRRLPPPPPPPFFFSYFILFGLEFADDLELTIILLFVIFFIHFLNLLRFIECLSPSLLIKARWCEHKCLDPADGSSCYDNPLHLSRAGRSTKNGIISSPLYV